MPTTIIVPPTVITPTPVTPVAAKPTFTDVPKQFWGETYISANYEKRGILDDFGTGTFDPTNQPITRGEYAKMLDRAFADKPTTNIYCLVSKISHTDYPRKEAIDKSSPTWVYDRLFTDKICTKSIDSSLSVADFFG